MKADYRSQYECNDWEPDRLEPQPPLIPELQFDQYGRWFYAIILPQGWKHGRYERPQYLRDHVPQLREGVWYWMAVRATPK